MKVYGCPEEIPAPEPDYTNYDFAKEQKREEEHSAKLKQWLIDAGYTGSHTGEIFAMPMADGAARYMIGDKGRSGILIHLPYGDAWDNRDAQYVPYKEVIRRVEARKNWLKIPPITESPNWKK